LRSSVRYYRGEYQNYAVLVKETEGWLWTEHFIVCFPLNSNAPISTIIMAYYEHNERKSVTLTRPYLHSSMVAEQSPLLLEAARFAEAAKDRVQREQYLVTR
jgi:hypothetical protein